MCRRRESRGRRNESGEPVADELEMLLGLTLDVALQVLPDHAVVAAGRGVGARHLLVGADELRLLGLGLLLHLWMFSGLVFIFFLFRVHDFSAWESASERFVTPWHPLSRNGHLTESCSISLCAMASGKMSPSPRLELSLGQVRPSFSHVMMQE